MSVTTGLGQVAAPGHGRRAELVSCLPALRESLERERAFRVEQLGRLTAAAGGAQAGTDAAAEARREVDALVLAAARRALADIERALEAIRSGRYGRCQDCAGEIPVAVLRAVPQTRHCLRCQRAGSAGPRVRAARG